MWQCKEWLCLSNPIPRRVMLVRNKVSSSMNTAIAVLAFSTIRMEIQPLNPQPGMPITRRTKNIPNEENKETE